MQLGQKAKGGGPWSPSLLWYWAGLVPVGNCSRLQQLAQPSHPTLPHPSAPFLIWRLAVLSALCAEATDESERLAEAGEIDASMAAVQTAERLRAEHERLAKKYTEPERYIMGEHAVHVL